MGSFFEDVYSSILCESTRIFIRVSYRTPVDPTFVRFDFRTYREHSGPVIAVNDRERNVSRIIDRSWLNRREKKIAADLFPRESAWKNEMWKQSFRQHELFIKAKLSMRHWWRSMSLHNALQESQRNWFHKTMMISSPGAPRKKKKKTLPEESNFGPWRYAADVYPTAPFRHNRSSSFFGLWLMLLGRKFRVSKWPGPFKLFQRLFFFFRGLPGTWLWDKLTSIQLNLSL